MNTPYRAVTSLSRMLYAYPNRLTEVSIKGPTMVLKDRHVKEERIANVISVVKQKKKVHSLPQGFPTGVFVCVFIQEVYNTK